MTPEGWVKLGKLRVGDRVAAARTLPVHAARAGSSEEVAAFADRVAEGRSHPNTCVPVEVFELCDDDLA